MTVIDNYPVPVWDSDWNAEICQRCGCTFEIELTEEPNRKQEWCREPDHLPQPGTGVAACLCHDGAFASDFLARMARLNEQDRYDREAKERRNPVIVSGEEVIGWIEPRFTSFGEDVA